MWPKTLITVIYNLIVRYQKTDVESQETSMQWCCKGCATLKARLWLCPLPVVCEAPLIITTLFDQVTLARIKKRAKKMGKSCAGKLTGDDDHVITQRGNKDRRGRGLLCGYVTEKNGT